MSIYFNRKPKHPPTILKEIPKATTHQISDIFSGEVVFNESTSIYSAHSEKVVPMTTLHLYQKPLTQKKTRKRLVSVKSSILP